MTKDVLRLAALLACMALATSRWGLIGHEVIAHGGVALAAGARITEVELFWFAGGWIRYTLPEPSLPWTVAIMMAGIALEIVVGLGLVLAVRGDSLGRRLVRSVGVGLLIHATWYLAVGTFHGFGDGILLYRHLADGPRVAISIAAGIATCAATFFGARAITAPLAKTMAGSTRQRVVGFAIAALLGGGLHAVLTIGELKLTRDPTYAKVMQPQRERQVAIELAQWERAQAARGEAPDAAAQRAERVRLERKHREFPFVIVLAVATLVAAIAGVLKSRGGCEEPIPNDVLFRAVVVALAAIFTVIVLGDLLPG
jgi:hypothetical protein